MIQKSNETNIQNSHTCHKENTNRKLIYTQAITNNDNSTIIPLKYKEDITNIENRLRDMVIQLVNNKNKFARDLVQNELHRMINDFEKNEIAVDVLIGSKIGKYFTIVKTILSKIIQDIPPYLKELIKMLNDQLNKMKESILMRFMDIEDQDMLKDMELSKYVNAEFNKFRHDQEYARNKMNSMLGCGRDSCGKQPNIKIEEPLDEFIIDLLSDSDECDQNDQTTHLNNDSEFLMDEATKSNDESNFGYLDIPHNYYTKRNIEKTFNSYKKQNKRTSNLKMIDKYNNLDNPQDSLKTKNLSNKPEKPPTINVLNTKNENTPSKANPNTTNDTKPKIGIKREEVTCTIFSNKKTQAIWIC